MDFDFTPEQQQLADTLRRYLDAEYGFGQRRAIIQSDSGTSTAAWRALADLGLMALPVPAAHGGFDGDAVDLLVVMQELGRALLVEPYWATMVGAEALRLLGVRGDLLEQVAAGEVRLAVGFNEPHARHDIGDIRTVAVPALQPAVQGSAARARGNGGQRSGEGPSWRLSGDKAVVWHGAQADYLIVAARGQAQAATAATDAGLGLFLVERGAVAHQLVDYRTIDGMRAANLVLRDTPAWRLDGPLDGVDEVDGVAGVAGGDSRDAGEVLERIADYGIVLLCAEALGVLDALQLATLDYTRTRQQFGTPIARFQALRHRLAEMQIHLEQARSATYLAAAMYASGDAAQRRRTASAAKVRVGQAGRFVGQNAIQLHGGMGVTDEIIAAHWFKRMTLIETMLGDSAHHLARFAALPGFAPAAQD